MVPTFSSPRRPGGREMVPTFSSEMVVLYQNPIDKKRRKSQGLLKGRMDLQLNPYVRFLTVERSPWTYITKTPVVLTTILPSVALLALFYARRKDAPQPHPPLLVKRRHRYICQRPYCEIPGVEHIVVRFIVDRAGVAVTIMVESGRGPARWCAGRPLAVSAVSGFVPV